MEKERNNVKQAIMKAGGALFFTLRDYREKKIENERLSLLSVLLLKSISSSASPVLQKVAFSVAREQKSDGGWVGVEDTAWRLALLGYYEKYRVQRLNGLRWLDSWQLSDGGWGRSSRDRARIPVTGTVLFLAPDIPGCDRAFKWLEQEILKEMELSPILSYKLAFTVLAGRNQAEGTGGISRDVLERVKVHLVRQQDVSGGWRYCQNHPVGPTPFCTALALAALTGNSSEKDEESMRKGATWLLEHQIDNGLWAEHYIEEGSAWALYALSEYYRLYPEK